MNKDRCKACGSCGFPMEKPEDFSLSNVVSLYCRHCTDETGKLLPYEAILKANTKYYIESQGISENVASKMAKDLLATMPAWKNRA